MSYNMIRVKQNMIDLLINNTVNTVDSAYKYTVDSLKIALSTKEKNTVISEVIGVIINC